jgi:hypothetical protein
LLLWLFGRFAASGSTVTAYAEAEEPVSTLINDYGPPVASAAAARRRAAMPFIHLERDIWDLRDASGAEIGPRVPESGPWLTGHGAVGRLRPTVEQLLVDPRTCARPERRLWRAKPESGGLLCFIDSMMLACPVRTGRANAMSASRPPGPVVSWGWKQAAVVVERAKGLAVVGGGDDPDPLG